MTRTIVDSLLHPDAWPWSVDQIELIETHISWVLLAGNHVVKLKRPVTLPFVDQSTLEARRELCEAELRLNSRLTDGVYQAVVPITKDGDGYRIDGDGEPIEWATAMRHLPHDRMLDVLIQTDQVPDDLVDRLADRLIPFHRDVAGACPGSPDTQARGATQVLLDNIDELHDLMVDRPFGATLDAITTAEREWIDAQNQLLRQRAEEGWIREGHGDLRVEHICMEANGAVQIFDCVEFSQEFRCADIASELAFLLMDLDRLGLSSTIGEELIERYRAAGIDLPTDLLALYWVHRALVRAKVDAIRMAESDTDDDSATLGDVSQYLHTAARRALNCAPVMIVMTGLSGTGKSTVARHIAHTLRTDHHRSDVIRKSLMNIDGDASAALDEGIYGQDTTEATYQRLLELGAQSIEAGHPVVLDATFLDATWRDAALQAAHDAGVHALLVETTTEPTILEQRLRERTARGSDPSDADVTIMQHQRQRLAESPPAIPDGMVTTSVDTTPEGFVDLDPVITALIDAGILRRAISWPDHHSGSRFR